MAITSLGCTVKQRVISNPDAKPVINEYNCKNHGVPYMKYQGTLYHVTGSIVAAEEKNAVYGQVHFISNQNNAQTNRRCELLRQQAFQSLTCRQVISELQLYLHNHNQWIKHYRNNIPKLQAASNVRLMIHDVPPKGEHRRRYNKPRDGDFSVVFDDKVDESRKTSRDIVVQLQNGHVQRISTLHSIYDPGQYILLFPHGDFGFSLNFKESCNLLTMRAYYAYLLSYRPSDFNHLLRSKMLTNAFVADMGGKIEQARLNFHNNHQKELRADKYKDFRKKMHDSNFECSKTGRKVILNSTLTGSARYYNELKLDALACVQEYHSPCLFITATCNTNWPEIKESMLPGDESWHRQDINARVFYIKIVKHMINDIVRKHALG